MPIITTSMHEWYLHIYTDFIQICYYVQSNWHPLYICIYFVAFQLIIIMTWLGKHIFMFSHESKTKPFLMITWESWSQKSNYKNNYTSYYRKMDANTEFQQQNQAILGGQVREQCTLAATSKDLRYISFPGSSFSAFWKHWDAVSK